MTTAPTLEYPFHRGARSSFNVVAVLCFFLIVAAPVGLWVLIRVAGARVRISASDVVAKGLGSTSFRFDEVARLGLLPVPIIARGIGGALVRRRVGGDKALHLVVKTTSGKTRAFIVSSYENHMDIVARVSERAGKRCESLQAGLIGPKWPNEA